ncbi:Ig-like domain-containing protein [Belliella sp. DSM 111904]|uniref:Ig-like domain-containing protein n=1 Tax=Belliella filtrata TaxID=2923435 RepID=A0ABS9UUQ9_9BACT|nr:Ig-like domain-containing domain [Belliella filtrata]MCH7407917.1 Ig-like domain-containing protein [Belliella filtrata]
MKFIKYILAIIIIICIKSCAKVSTPMGGEKDEDPPILISMKPSNESINIKPTTIELEFNEYIKLENANKQIIVTPRINKDEMVATAIKNKVNIKLNQELEDSTTYVFNFQKSIQDITEGNPAENLKLVFSTGNEIDSLKFTGRVSYVFPQKDKFIKDVLIGLYEKNDTTDVLLAPPYYIAAADTAGRFEITNIKAGEYRAYAWHDSNNTLKAEDKSEAYAFFGDTITINDDINDVQFLLSKADLSDLRINRASTTGENYDVVLSKDPVSIQVDHKDFGNELFYRKNEKNLRFYHTSLRNDSIQIALNLRDSVGFKVDTLIYLKFEESDRRKEALETTTNTGTSFLKKIQAEFSFNKPIKEIKYDSLFVKYDSASIIPIEPKWVYLPDSSLFTKIKIDIPIPDSISNSTFQIFAADSTFFDIENMFNEKKIEANYKKLNPETLVTELLVTIDSEKRPLILELLDKSGKIYKTVYLTETNKHSFLNLEPATYQLRVIVDENKNRKWDPSNMRENRQAEQVWYYTNPDDPKSYDIPLKAGWTNEITVIPRTKRPVISEPIITDDENESATEIDVKEPVEEEETSM